MTLKWIFFSRWPLNWFVPLWHIYLTFVVKTVSISSIIYYVCTLRIIFNCIFQGGVCEDGNINLIASHFLEHFANSVLDPLYGFANILSILINTVGYAILFFCAITSYCSLQSVSSFTGLFYENAEAPSLVDNTQNYFVSPYSNVNIFAFNFVNNTYIFNCI